MSKGRNDLSGAVVVGLDCVTGLQTARILAGRGIPVIGIAEDPNHFACRTRVCQSILYADTHTDEFIVSLEELAPTLCHPAVLYPCTDLAVLQISRQRERLEPQYHVVLPPGDVIETLMDKARFYEHCEREGLPIPRTRLLRSSEDAADAAEALRFPLIVKPPMRSLEWEAQGFSKVYRVGTPEELITLYGLLSPWAEALAAQEWVEGGDSELFSCNCYFDRSSRPLAAFVARKIRQWPPHAGTSSLGEECRNDVVLYETLRLFEGVGFRGLGYVEMKRDHRTGEHFMLEANVGRPTGRSAIAELGGVELLYAQYCDTLGLPLPDGLEQRFRGTKWIYLRHDVQSALSYWWHGQLTLRAWASSWRGIKSDAVFSLRDPAPFWADLWQTAKRTAGRRMRD